MKARKSNKSYSIEPREIEHFKSQGYDIYDDNDVLVAYGAGKMFPADKVLALVKENEELKAQIKSSQIKSLSKKSKKVEGEE